MTRRARPRRALWLACWLALGCRTESKDTTTALCQKACSTLSESERERAHCEQTCTTTEREAQRAACVAEQRAYLRCAAQHGNRSASKPAWMRLAHGEVSDDCAPAQDAFKACMLPCNDLGVVRTANRTVTDGSAQRAVAAEQVGAGCDLPEKNARQRSPAGAPCQHSSVCSFSRCSCPGTQIGFLARACVDGRCANPEEACRLVPLAVDYSGCRGKR